MHLFQLPGLVSVSWGSCGLLSVPRARSLCCGVYVHLSPLTACTLSRGLFVLLLVLPEGGVRCPSLYAFPLSAPQSRPFDLLIFETMWYES